MGEEQILRVPLAGLDLWRGRRPEGLGQHEGAHELLDRPPFRHETRREIIQQLRVGWQLAHVAKIVRGADQSPTEHPLPDTIDHHAGRERVVATGNQFRELATPAARRIHYEPRGGQCPQVSARHQFTRPRVIASREQWLRYSVTLVGHPWHHGWQRQ